MSSGSGPDVEIRSIGPDEIDAYNDAVAHGFLDEPSEEGRARVRRTAEPARMLAAFDRGKMVATTRSYPLTLTVPGGEAATAGVTAVTVQPTHRRRGILTGLMRAQLDDLRAGGHELAMLWASEGAIYPRYGYGLATMNGRMEAIRARIAFRDEPAAGRVRLVDQAEALELIPAIFDRARRDRPGFFSRTADWWELRTFADDSESRRGAGPLFRAILERDGDAQAYALYRFEHVWDLGVPAGRLHVQEAEATSPLAHREMWRYLFGVDLVSTVSARKLAVDDPLALLVTEPTALRLSIGDGLFLRLVDLPAALEARGYAADGELVLDVVDDFCPWNATAWRLAVRDGRATVERTSDSPDLQLRAGDLASAYLGAFTFAGLARAVRVEQRSPGAVERADGLFRTARAPFCPESF
jgi:predicted acetyltransferase